MLTQKYRSESDLVIWLLFGFEEVIDQVTDRECPLAHVRPIGITLTWLAACTHYGVIFNTSHYFFVIVISLMEPIRFVYYTKSCFNDSLSRGGHCFILNVDIYPIYFD